MASHDARGHRAPLPVHWLWARVAPGHLQGCRAAREAVASWAAVGTGSDRGPAPDRGPGRTGTRVAWDTAHDAVLAEGKRVLIDDEHRFDGVSALGVDEHDCRHTRRGDKYVTVIIDLTGIRDGAGPARLLDMVKDRSKQAFKTLLTQRPQEWRDQVEVVAMDGFTGFKTATGDELPDAVAVIDAFHVLRLGGEALDSADDGSRRPSWATGAARATRSTAPVGPCPPALTCSPTSRRTAWPRCSTPLSMATSTSRSRPTGASTSA